MEFLRSFLRRNCAGRPVVTSRNVDRLLSLWFTSLVAVPTVPLFEFAFISQYLCYRFTFTSVTDFLYCFFYPET